MLMFQNKILIIGYGSVAKCVLPLLFKHIDIPYSNVTVMDFMDQHEALQHWTAKGVHYVQEKILLENMHEVLSQFVSSGDMIVELAWNIGTASLLQWCYDQDVFHLNTSVGIWEPFQDTLDKPILEKTLYWRQMQLHKTMANWKKNSRTALVDHGANPGLISHFTKQGLMDIAHKSLKDGVVSKEKIALVENALSEQNFAQLAMHLDVKVIHCSERDMQVPSYPKEIDEFVNTWGVEGLAEEGMAPSELGWGTHEKTLPQDAYQPDYGPKNQIFLPRMGINTWVRSWIPSQEIVGMLIRHGEAFGISKHLTVWGQEGEEKGHALYRPTVHYAYMPSNETLTSLHELRARNYKMPPDKRILTDEILRGEDALGALIMGHSYNSWWTGSILSIEESRSLVPHQNATTVQVAIGVVAAMMWMIENPNQGFCLPDNVPHEFVLDIAKPYLGQFVSQSYDWTPKTNYHQYFKENTHVSFNEKELWSFENFSFK